MNRTLWLILTGFGSMFLADALASAGPRVTALVGGTVVNLDGHSPLENAVILVEEERITAIGSVGDIIVPRQAAIIDTTGTWLVPGLMNMHVHLGLVLPGKMAEGIGSNSRRTTCACSTPSAIW